MGKTPFLEKLYRQHWLDSVGDLGISDEERKAALKRMEYDRMATLDIQLDWLEAVGFQDVDCWYKNFSFAVFGGHRPKSSIAIQRRDSISVNSCSDGAIGTLPKGQSL
jgi:tRNA (cmo5U34)-methyltransferase